MNFSNELFFNEVPGYDSSKGERIFKALHKLRIKISRLEQVRILEKGTHSKDSEAREESDVTISDIQVELLRTQMCYLIKKAKEFPKHQGNLSSESNAFLENYSHFKPVSPKDHQDKSNFVIYHEDASCSTSDLLNKHSIDTSIKRTHNEQEGFNSNEKSCLSKESNKVANIHPRTNPQLHYHLKLDDVPFILGASSTASHSIVANVQNIIAMMKRHNKALCASNHHFRQTLSSKPSTSKRLCTQDTNDEIIQELSEDLSKLLMKQEEMKHQFFKNTQAADQCDAGKDANKSDKNRRQLKNVISTHSNEDSIAPSKELMKNKQKESSRNEEKHLVFTDKMKGSNLVRRKMLRSLQDFKVHLSEEDILWK